MADIRTWFMQLADPSPDVRQTAFDNLLALSAADLPALQRVASSARPLRPSQRASLQQIVNHVYKSGIEYEVSPIAEGFLGVSWDYVEWDLDTDRKSGVIIKETEQGFPAYRLLRPGDIIKGVEGLPNLTFDNNAIFQSVIRGYQPGETIVLLIERDGKTLSVSITLRARPSALDNNILQDVTAWREWLQEQADRYWNEHFAKILDDPAT